MKNKGLIVAVGMGDTIAFFVSEAKFKKVNGDNDAALQAISKPTFSSSADAYDYAKHENINVIGSYECVLY